MKKRREENFSVLHHQIEIHKVQQAWCDVSGSSNCSTLANADGWYRQSEASQ